MTLCPCMFTWAYKRFPLKWSSISFIYTDQYLHGQEGSGRLGRDTTHLARVEDTDQHLSASLNSFERCCRGSIVVFFHCFDLTEDLCRYPANLWWSMILNWDIGIRWECFHPRLDKEMSQFTFRKSLWTTIDGFWSRRPAMDDGYCPMPELFDGSKCIAGTACRPVVPSSSIPCRLGLAAISVVCSLWPSCISWRPSRKAISTSIDPCFIVLFQLSGEKKFRVHFDPNSLYCSYNLVYLIKNLSYGNLVTDPNE